MWIAVDSRPVPYQLLFSNSLPFSILLLFWDEARKYLANKHLLIGEKYDGWWKS